MSNPFTVIVQAAGIASAGRYGLGTGEVSFSRPLLGFVLSDADTVTARFARSGSASVDNRTSGRSFRFVAASTPRRTTCFGLWRHGFHTGSYVPGLLTGNFNNNPQTLCNKRQSQTESSFRRTSSASFSRRYISFAWFQVSVVVLKMRDIRISTRKSAKSSATSRAKTLSFPWKKNPLKDIMRGRHNPGAVHQTVHRSHPFQTFAVLFTARHSFYFLMISYGQNCRCFGSCSPLLGGRKDSRGGAAAMEAFQETAELPLQSVLPRSGAVCDCGVSGAFALLLSATVVDETGTEKKETAQVRLDFETETTLASQQLKNGRFEVSRFSAIHERCTARYTAHPPFNQPNNPIQKWSEP